jgi:hypothetical protein
MLHIQISNRHMCVEAGPASQDAVIKSISASPGLQCIARKIAIRTTFYLFTINAIQDKTRIEVFS